MRKRHLIQRIDIVIAVCLLVSAVISGMILWTQPAGTTVVFRKDGVIVDTRSLDNEGIVEISGDYHNVFEISDGSIRVIETDCPNGACEAVGSISIAGSAIICAPNHVSATIEGSDGLDAFTG